MMEYFIKIFQKKIVLLIDKIHLIIFGYGMSDEMMNFGRHFAWSLFGTLFYALFFFVSNILIGRELGPEEYGKYIFVFTAASFLVVFMSAGLETTTVKYVSVSKKENDQNHYFSNGIIGMLVISSMIIFGVLVFHHQIELFFNSTFDAIWISLLLAFLLTFKQFMDGFSRALQHFVLQAKARIIEGLIFFMVVVYFSSVAIENTSNSFVTSLVVAAFVAMIFYLLKFKKNIVGWSDYFFLRSKNYQKHAAFVSFAGIFIGTLDKFVIVRFLGPSELGIYGAYYLASVSVVGQLSLALNNVFFPMINRIEDKLLVMKKINRMMLVAFVPAFLVISLFMVIVLKLFGNMYDMNLLYISLFSFIAFLQLLLVFYGAITSSNQELFKFTSRIYYFKPIFIGLLYIILIYSGNLDLLSVLIILIFSCLYDIMNTKLAFHLTWSNRNNFIGQS